MIRKDSTYDLKIEARELSEKFEDVLTAVEIAVPYVSLLVKDNYYQLTNAEHAEVVSNMALKIVEIAFANK